MRDFELSPLSLSFRAHYKMLDAESGPWTLSRVRGLCNSLRISEDELAQFLRIPTRKFRVYLITGFPPWLRLMLVMIEGWVKRTRLGDTETQIFPTHLLK